MHPCPTPFRAARRCRAAAAVILAIALSGCSPRAPTAPERAPDAATSRPPGPPTGAPSRVVVRLEPGVSPHEIAASVGSEAIAIVPELSLVLLRTPAGLSDEAFIRRLALDPRVLFSEPDYSAWTVEGRQSTIAFSEGSRSWADVTDQAALVRIGVEAAHAVARGRGALVAVLDSGVELAHPVFAGRLALPGIEPGVTVSPGDDRPQGVDTNLDGVVDGALGHGTHVAGIVLAVAPQARVLPIRVLDSDGVGYAFSVVRGLVAAVGRGAQVANLSFAMNGASLAVAAALDYARAAGVVLVAPAGNAGMERVEFPAAFAAAVAVAGTDESDRKTAFSNYGAAVDVAAPAAGILSAYVGGGFATWSGTSMAAPFVSGVAALIYGTCGGRRAAAAAFVERAIGSGALRLDRIEPVYAAALGAGRVSAAGSLHALHQPGDTPDPWLRLAAGGP